MMPIEEVMEAIIKNRKPTTTSVVAAATKAADEGVDAYLKEQDQQMVRRWKETGLYDRLNKKPDTKVSTILKFVEGGGGL
ncbi:MAG TPA: hypothetical protein VI033_03580 [Candidatus Nitrosopolaris sp.]